MVFIDSRPLEIPSLELWQIAVLVLLYVALIVGVAAWREARSQKRKADRELDAPESVLDLSTGRFLGETDRPEALWGVIVAYDIRDFHKDHRTIGLPNGGRYTRFVPVRPNTQLPYLQGMSVGTVWVTEAAQNIRDEGQVVELLRRAGLTQPLDTFKIVEM